MENVPIVGHSGDIFAGGHLEQTRISIRTGGNNI